MNKVSTRQAMLMIFTLVFSPAVRLFASYINEETSQSGWLGVIAAGAAMLAFSFVLQYLLERDKSYTQLLKEAFGSILGKIIALIYLLWGTILIALQLGYYGERLTSSVYSGFEIDIFVIVMALLCIYALKNGISTIARANEIIVVIIVPVTVGLLTLLTKDININSLFPINNRRDIFYVARCSLASFGYMTFVLFFSDEMTEKRLFRKQRIYTVLSFTALTLWMFVAVLGNIGPFVVQKLQYPFFSVVKQISVGEFIQHIEALTVALWMLSDFVLIAVTILAMIKLLQETVNIKPSESLIPYVALCVTLVPIMGKSNYERQMISSKIYIPSNLLMLFAVPLIIAVIFGIKSVFVSTRQ